MKTESRFDFLLLSLLLHLSTTITWSPGTRSRWVGKSSLLETWHFHAKVPWSALSALVSKPRHSESNPTISPTPSPFKSDLHRFSRTLQSITADTFPIPLECLGLSILFTVAKESWLTCAGSRELVFHTQPHIPPRWKIGSWTFVLRCRGEKRDQQRPHVMGKCSDILPWKLALACMDIWLYSKLRQGKVPVGVWWRGSFEGNIFLASWFPESFYVLLAIIFCLRRPEYSKCFIMSLYKLAAAAALLLVRVRTVDNGLDITPQMIVGFSLQAYKSGIWQLGRGQLECPGLRRLRKPFTTNRPADRQVSSFAHVQQ